MAVCCFRYCRDDLLCGHGLVQLFVAEPGFLIVLYFDICVEDSNCVMTPIFNKRYCYKKECYKTNNTSLHLKQVILIDIGHKSASLRFM